MAQYEVTLRDYWRILRRRKGIVIFTAFLLGFFSFVMAQVWQPIPEYTASAKIQIESNQSVTNLYLESFGYSVGDQIETQISVIESFPVVRRAAEVMGLLDEAASVADTTVIVMALQSRIDVDQEGYANILVIEVTDTNPVIARDLANVLAQVYKEHDYEQKNRQAEENREFVEKQRDDAREQLISAEEEARDYREKHDIVSMDAQASVILGQITESERNKDAIVQTISVIDGMLAEIKKDRELTQKTLQGASQMQVGNSIMMYIQQLHTLNLEKKGLLVQFTEEHPKVKQLDARIDQLIGTMGEELKQRRKMIATDLVALGAKLDQLHIDYKHLPTLGLELGRRERKVLLLQQVVGALEEELQGARIREANKVDSVQLMQAAIDPQTADNPHNPLERAVMGMILGLVLGVVFAVIAETLDTSIGTIEDVQDYTGSKVVGVIPFIRAESVTASMERRGIDIEDERALQRMAQLVTYFDPQSTLAETYRTLRTNIEFVTVEKGDKTMMVTSSTSGEGKSTVVANLAMAMAQLGKRTLLVDCDLRKPTVARMFGLDKEPGLAEVIVGNYAWLEVVRTVTDIVTGGMGMEDLMQTQGISNLHIITSGAIPPNPAELLNSHNMADFVEAVSEVYDIVLFDAPPVLHVTDAAILGKKVDGALVVYKAGDIPRTSLKRTVNLLNSVEVDMLGIVLNGIRAETSTDYYDFGYSSYYGYGQEIEQEKTWYESMQTRVYDLFNRSGRDADYDVDADRDVDIDADRDEDEPVFVRENGRDTTSMRKAVGTVLLGLFGLGLVWQSGYLLRPLGLLPVFAGYSEGVHSSPAPEDALQLSVGDVSLQSEEVPVDARSPLRSVEGTVEATTTVEVDRGVAAIPAPQSPALTAKPGRAVAISTVAKPKPITSKPHPYALRIASYAQSSKWAISAVDQLREVGLHAFLVPLDSPADGKPMIRLMVGGFPNWDAAYREGQHLQQSGQLERFTIAYLPFAAELDNFAEFDQADRAIAGLGEKSYFCYVQSLAADMHRVLAGAFETDAEARDFLNEFDAQAAGRIVRR